MSRKLSQSPVGEHVELGPILSHTLENGLRIFAREDRHAPVVSLQVWVRTGSIHEGEYLGCGLSHFLEHMIFQGSGKYPGSAVADTVNRLGGSINAYTSHGVTVYHVNMHAEHVREGLDMLSDAIMNPLFPEEEFAREKDVILRERDMCRDNPSRVLSEKMLLTLFRDHPFRHPIIGYREKIESVDRKMMLDYYNRRYRPERTFFVLNGNLDADKAVKWLSETLFSWKMGRIDDPVLPLEKPLSAPRRMRFSYPDPLARFAACYHIPDASHPDIPALDVASAILGQGKSSRLFSRLHDSEKIAIHVDAFNYTSYFAGLFGVCAVCEAPDAEKVEKAVGEEIDKLAAEGASPGELKRVLRYVRTNFYRGMYSCSGIARTIGDSVLCFGVPDYAGHYIRKVSELRSKDVKHVLKKYLDHDRAALVHMLPDKEEKDFTGPAVKKKAKDSSPGLHTLTGGIRTVSFEDSSLPMVDICAVLPGGGILEGAEKAGISRIIAALMSSRTALCTEKKFGRILDDNAIALSVTGGNNTLCIQMNCHKDAFDEALMLFAQILSAPPFDDAELLEREKRNMANANESRNLSPQCAAEDALRAAIFGGHPYAQPPTGTAESVRNFRSSDLKKFYSGNCLSANFAVLGIAGDVDPEKARADLERTLAGVNWVDSEPNYPERPVFPARAFTKTVKVPREQSVVMLGVPGIDNSDESRFSVNIARSAMNGLSSGLHKRIREREGLAYYTGFMNFTGIHEGMLALYAGTSPGSAAKVAALLEKERKSLAAGKGIAADQVDAAKACIRRELAEQKRQTKMLLFNSALAEFYGHGYREPWLVDKHYERITPGEVKLSLRKLFKTESVFNITAGPQ